MIGGGWVLVLVTTQNKEEAERIAEDIVKNKLAACTNIVEEITSIYWWNNRVEKSSEALLIIKTKVTQLGKLVRRIKSLHSYEVPEIIALPIIGGYPDYLKWLDNSVKANHNDQGNSSSR